MYTEIFFDIETQKLFDQIDPADHISKLGISIVSVYKRQLDADLKEIDGRMYSFYHQDLSQMWPLFGNVHRCIGFNSLKFDNPILAPFCPFDFHKLSHFDILDQVKRILGHRLSLDAIASQTLGRTKNDVGTNAVLYWQQNTPQSLEKLKTYCEADVMVTRDVYDYGLKHGHLKYKDRWNTLRDIPVDFSHPARLSNDQTTLF